MVLFPSHNLETEPTRSEEPKHVACAVLFDDNVEGQRLYVSTIG